MCQHDSDEQLLTYFRTYELCIITAKAEELHVILNAINPLDVQIPRRYRFSSRPGFHSQDIYTSYFILENGHTLPFYITSCSDQGIQNFAIETTSLFNKLEPKFAIHAGVCAAAESLDPEVEVICGDVAFNYEEGKASSRGLAPTTRQKGDTNGDFRAWVGSDQTRKYGTFISGCAVREDAQKFIKSAQDRVDRETAALDMEASAFFNICERLRHVKSLGVIKGISDHGNTNKKLDNKERYVPALCSTAKTIKEWVKHHFSIENATDHVRTIPLGSFYAQLYHKEYQVLLMRILTSNKDTDEPIEGLTIVLPYPGESIVAKLELFNHGAVSRKLYYHKRFVYDFPKLDSGVLRLTTDGIQRFESTLRLKVVKELQKEFEAKLRVGVAPWPMPDTGEEVGTSSEGTVATKSNVALKAPKSSNNKKRQQRSPNPVDTPGPKRRRTTNPVYDTTSGAASRPATRSETMRQRNQRNKG